jgi:hypothetical protein
MTLSHKSGLWPAGVIFCALLKFAALACAGTYSGGSGTAEDPYQIASAEDFIALGQFSTDFDKSFILMADLDMSAYSGQQFTVIGHFPQTKGFSGVFDGNGHVIRNLTYTENDYQGQDMFRAGLFGRLDSKGEIRNLGVEDLAISCRAVLCLGGLVGENLGRISGCYTTGSVSGIADSIGGLVGADFGSISDCYSACTVRGDKEVGGLAGYIQLSLTRCFATGSVGGIGETSTVGGLVGRNAGTISACYATGPVNGVWYVGGLVGRNSVVGKLVKCYATGWVSQGGYAVGGLAGAAATRSSTDCFWDVSTSGMIDGIGLMDPDPSSVKGVDTAEMKTRSTFVGAGWDMMGIWMICEGTSYPHLTWEKYACLPPDYSGGSGAAEDPYRIRTACDWQELIVTPSDWDKHFILLDDLDFGGIYLTPVAPTTNISLGQEFQGTPFTGVFEGNGHAFLNFRIDCGNLDYVGLFGCIGGIGQVRNLRLVNIRVGGRMFTGGLCGENNGTISASSVSGDCFGSYPIGGLCGWNHGTIQKCSSATFVRGNAVLGGICGWNPGGTIDDCYSTGRVETFSEGSVFVGGLCGNNDQGTLVRCFSTGEISATRANLSYVGGLCGGDNHRGVVVSCFWDMLTSKQKSSAGGIGKTTAEMKTLATFANAGWDFVGETKNGTADVWRMCRDGVSYPRLSWEFSQGGDMDCPDGVGMEDLLYLAGRWMESVPEVMGAADADGSGKVDLSDFEILAANWMRT